jgi:diacylglycerol kinase family enzyme
MLFGARGPWVCEVAVEELRCVALVERPATPPVYAQADAEPMGTLPVRLRVVQDALMLLMPRA